MRSSRGSKYNSEQRSTRGQPPSETRHRARHAAGTGGAYWQDGILHDPEACSARDFLINTIGNLTLVTKSLNSTLSNRPWTDGGQRICRGAGRTRDLGKRSLLNKYSVLMLSRPIIDEHRDTWNDEEIADRSVVLAKLISKAWPRG